MSRIDGGLRKEFHNRLPELHWQAVETGGVGSGVPDSNFCLDGIEGWIEFKKTTGWALDIDTFQVGWHMRRNRAGGRTFIGVRRQNVTVRNGAVDQLWIFPGVAMQDLYLDGLKTKAYAPMLLAEGGPSKWPWTEVKWILLGNYSLSGASGV